MDNDNHPIGRGKDLSYMRKKMPHWEVENGAYFVTLCLQGAIPAALAARLRDMAAALKELDPAEITSVRRRIFLHLEHQLHLGEGPRHFGVPAIAAMVVAAILHRVCEGTWILYEWCLMPNHLHMFLRLVQGTTPGMLESTLTAFKRWTGRQALSLCPEIGTRFWQREWFDHWSRSQEDDRKAITYIRNNPVKAGLTDNYRKWPYGSWAYPQPDANSVFAP